MKLIDKSALVAEIERFKENANKRGAIGKVSTIVLCNELLSFIDTLEVKEVDLEKSARYYLLHEHSSPLNVVLHQAELKVEMQYHKDIEDAYKAGFELGLKVKQESNDDVKIGEAQIYLEDDGGEPPYDGKQWLDLSCTEYEIPKALFKDGDNVEILIRKAQKGE